MIANFPNVGQTGINQDLSVHDLPSTAWTDANNVRFIDGYAQQFYGHGQVYGTPTVKPYHTLPVISGSSRYWLYASLAKIYAVTISGGAAVHTNLTRQTAGVDVNYSGSINGWTSTVFGGIPILNPGNTTDPPQQWDLNISNRMAALSNWPASTYCKSLRAYKNSLIALNLTISSVNYPYMVKWSHPAVPGAVPSSWDETDPTLDAGQFDLAEGYDQIVDGLALRDSFIVYKENSVWRIDFTGGQSVYRSQKVLGTSGAMNRNCIVEIDGYHVVLTTNDIIIHDGVQAYSVLDKITRRWLFAHLDTAYSSYSFVFKNPFFNEVYICFCEIGQSIPGTAIVYNYKDKAISKRDIPSIYHANYGQIDTSLNSTWAADSDPWNSDLTLWNAPDFVPNASRVLMCSDDTKLFLLDASSGFDGSIPDAYMERRGLSFGQPERIKLIKGIRPRITGNTGQTLTIKIGSQDDPYEDPTYTSMTHTIGSTIRNDCLVSGRYIAIRVESGTAYTARVDSFDIEYELLGDW